MLVFLVFIGESADYITQTQQTLVDTDTFLHQLPCSTSSLDSFGTRQIYEVKLSSNLLLLLPWKSALRVQTLINFFDDFLFNRNCEDSMRPGRAFIHKGRACRPLVNTFVEER